VSLFQNTLVRAYLALQVLSDIVHSPLVVHLSNNASLAVVGDRLQHLQARDRFSLSRVAS